VLGGGLLAVTARKIFRSAIYLLFCLVGIAGLYFYMNYEFIAAVQIVVYVGGIVVLIIFSVFLTHESGGDMKRPNYGRMIFSGLAGCFGFALVMMMIREYPFMPDEAGVMEASANNIGSQMLSTTEHGYILPFEVVSMLLLAAMIGCIVIAMKTRVTVVNGK
jgi:NADH-quinone oxidoreductase subunit J